MKFGSVPETVQGGDDHTGEELGNHLEEMTKTHHEAMQLLYQVISDTRYVSHCGKNKRSPTYSINHDIFDNRDS